MDSIRNLFGNRMTSEKTSPQNNESYDEENHVKTNPNYVYNRNRTISETSSCSVNSATDSAEPHPQNTNTKTCNKDSESYFWIMWRS